MTSKPDRVLLASREQARHALAEITEPHTIGEDAGHETHDEHVLTLYFECLLAGYPGWRWAATLARVNKTSPVNVLEVELLPGEGSVTAPDWVPWSVRLSQYRETQARQAAEEAAAAEAAAAELAEDDTAASEVDLMDNDFSDFTIELDGVDVDDYEDEDEDEDEAREEGEEDTDRRTSDESDPNHPCEQTATSQHLTASP